MANFLLVHGEWHDATMWDGVIRHLESAREGLDVGRVIAVDLPGHGARRSFDIGRITLDYYVEAVVTPPQVDHLSGITVAAHSFAAAFMPQVAERLGDALERVVFIGGLIPPEGSTPFEALPLLTRKATGTFRPTEKGIRPSDGVLKKSLYNDVGGVEAEKRVSRLVAEPYLPWVTPAPAPQFPAGVSLTYVVLGKDRFLSPQKQRAFAAALPGAEVVEVDAGRLAPVVRPERIGDILLRGVGPRPLEEAAAGAEK